MSIEEGGHNLTRKQLRELRLTGATPVIESGDSSDAAADAGPERPNETSSESTESSESSELAETAELAEITDPPASTGSADVSEPADGEAHSLAAAASPAAEGAAPLTRRAARERMRTGSVPVLSADHPSVEEPVIAEPMTDETVVAEPTVAEPVIEAPEGAEPVLVSGVPRFATPAHGPAASREGEPEDDELPGVEHAPVRAQQPADDEQPDSDTSLEHASEAAGSGPQPERPMVGASFGIGVKRKPVEQPRPAAFDEILETDSAGSHKTASTLIFTPSPDAGSLSGPVAATGELLITGTYALPEGMGSQGHALGTTDGKDVDAVLLDNELAPASSPTPIAASSAIATSKPAGEVIRPPAPDKGGTLTLTLAIVAGGLALALAASLIIAFTTGVLG